MKNVFEPPESPRAISILNIRKTAVALAKFAGLPPPYTPYNDEQVKFILDRIKEADRKSATSLQGNPRGEGIANYDAQQRLIGAGKRPADVYDRDELIKECHTVIRADKARLVEITSELIPLARQGRDWLLELTDKVPAALDAEGQKQAEAFGIGFFQSSLTAQVIRDIRRRLEKLIPNEGAMRSPRAMFEAFLDDCAPIAFKDPLAVHQEEKRGFLARTADAIKQAVAEEPDRRQAAIAEANKEKEARKKQMAAQGIIKLGDGK